MPFKSERQRRYLWANRPDIARRWTDTYGSSPRSAALEEMVKARRKKKKR